MIPDLFEYKIQLRHSYNKELNTIENVIIYATHEFKAPLRISNEKEIDEIIKLSYVANHFNGSPDLESAKKIWLELHIANPNLNSNLDDLQKE